MFRRRRERFSALNVFVELASSLAAIWIFFVLKIINCPACADEPVTIFRYIIFLTKSLMNAV